MHRSIYFLAIAIFSVAAPAAAQQKFVLDPKATKRAGRPPTLVTGSFEVKGAWHGSTSRKGGACLIFRPADDNQSCETEAECVSAANLLFEVKTGAYGYCVPRRPPASGKMCWYKPPDAAPTVENGMRVSQYCVKSANDLPLGEIHLPAVHAFPLGVKPTYWRVTTCQSLEPYPPGSTTPGCASQVDGNHKAVGYGRATRFQ